MAIHSSGQTVSLVQLPSSMDCFISIPDLAPLISEESACIQYLFDEDLLHTKMRCRECNAELTISPKVYKNIRYLLNDDTRK